jgi:hypothetical protein
MADWTILGTALISAGSGIAGAGLGYATARRQASAELQRVNLEHGEEHLRHRQAVYHDFFDSALRFHQAQSVEPFETREAYTNWSREFEHNLVAVSLFGTEDAWLAAQHLAKVIYAAMADGTAQYVTKHERAFLEAWDDAIRAMRPDTAPPRGSAL